MKKALADFARADTPEARARVFDALGAAVVYACVAADPRAGRTGFEPAFTLAPVAGRAFVLGAAPGGGRSLLLFPDRRGADAWSARVPGFAAEPLAGPMAVNVAELAGAELMVLDPLGAAFPIDRRTMEWCCPRAARPPATFAERASAWIERDTPETFGALLEAWRYAVFYVQVVNPGRTAPADTAAIVHASVGGCRLLLDLDGDTAYLTGNTERAVVEGWCAGGDYLCLALDGPALLEAASLVGADVGVMVGLAKTLAIGADDRDLWPRRPLTADDL